MQYLKKCEDLFEKAAEMDVEKEMATSDSKAKVGKVSETMIRFKNNKIACVP